LRRVEVGVRIAKRSGANPEIMAKRPTGKARGVRIVRDLPKLVE
jgi:hypothetical protein